MATPPSRAKAGDVVQVLVGVADRHLQPEGGEDDAGDQQQVDVGVGVAGELVLDPAGLGFGQAPGRDQGDDVEVDPPQRRREDDAEHGGGADPEVELRRRRRPRSRRSTRRGR